MTFDALVAEARRTGRDLTDAQAEELVEQTLATGRSGLNEAEFVRVREFLRADPDDGPALFASKGTAVIDDPVTAGRYADLCLNSFAGGTLVVLADGSRVPITSVSVGDRVAAFDVSLGLVVDRPVTAVLSHDDVLFDVSLSDGSMLSVTEDHSVFEVSSRSWMPISEFDADDVLLGLSGETLTVTDFDETSGANTTAWDLSVGSAHNFYVAGDHDAVPVLVHNASDFCPLPVTLAQFKTLADITDPVEAAAYADVLTSFGRIAQLNDLGAEAYEASVKALVDFAGTNRELATELVTTRPLWVKAASVNGDGPLADVLDAAVSTPALRTVAPDRMLQMVRRSDLDDVLASLPSVNRLSNPQPELVSHILGRPDAVDILQAMDETPIDGAAPVLAGRAAGETTFAGKAADLDRYLDGWMDVRSRGAAVFSPDSSSVSAFLAELPTSPTLSPVWRTRGVDRGLILEEYDMLRFGGRIPPELNTYAHRFYEAVDNFRGGVATQYKTVNFATQRQTASSINDWVRDMEIAINNLATFRREGVDAVTRGGVTVPEILQEQIGSTRFEVVITPRLSNDPVVRVLQVDALNRVAEYATTLQNGVVPVDDFVLRWAN